MLCNCQLPQQKIFVSTILLAKPSKALKMFGYQCIITFLNLHLPLSACDIKFRILSYIVLGYTPPWHMGEMLIHLQIPTRVMAFPTLRQHVHIITLTVVSFTLLYTSSIPSDGHRPATILQIILNPPPCSQSNLSTSSWLHSLPATITLRHLPLHQLPMPPHLWTMQRDSLNVHLPTTFVGIPLPSICTLLQSGVWVMQSPFCPTTFIQYLTRL